MIYSALLASVQSSNEAMNLAAGLMGITTARGFSGRRAEFSFKKARPMTPPVTALYAPASPTERALLLDLATAAVERLHYLQITDRHEHEEEREMVSVRLHSRRTSFAAEAVKKDVRKVWQEMAAPLGAGMFKEFDTDTGFAFRFAIMNAEGHYITGTIVVELA